MNTTVEHSPTLATTHQGEPCIALDGDQMKPREDQRKGGNGFGANEDGAGYTLTGVDRHGVAYGIDQQGGKGGANTTEGVAPTVLSDSHGTPHGVAYGMDARNTGLYGEKATGKEVSMTQDANQCKGGRCVVFCADGGEVASTITRQISEQSGQDNRANAVVQCYENHAQDSRIKPTTDVAARAR